MQPTKQPQPQSQDAQQLAHDAIKKTEEAIQEAAKEVKAATERKVEEAKQAIHEATKPQPKSQNAATK